MKVDNQLELKFPNHNCREGNTIYMFHGVHEKKQMLSIIKVSHVCLHEKPTVCKWRCVTCHLQKLLKIFKTNITYCLYVLIAHKM